MPTPSFKGAALFVLGALFVSAAPPALKDLGFEFLNSPSQTMQPPEQGMRIPLQDLTGQANADIGRAITLREQPALRRIVVDQILPQKAVPEGVPTYSGGDGIKVTMMWVTKNLLSRRESSISGGGRGVFDAFNVSASTADSLVKMTDKSSLSLVIEVRRAATRTYPGGRLVLAKTIADKIAQLPSPTYKQIEDEVGDGFIASQDVVDAVHLVIDLSNESQSRQEGIKGAASVGVPSLANAGAAYDSISTWFKATDKVSIQLEVSGSPTLAVSGLSKDIMALVGAGKSVNGDKVAKVFEACSTALQSANDQTSNVSAITYVSPYHAIGFEPKGKDKYASVSALVGARMAVEERVMRLLQLQGALRGLGVKTSDDQAFADAIEAIEKKQDDCDTAFDALTAAPFLSPTFDSTLKATVDKFKALQAEITAAGNKVITIALEASAGRDSTWTQRSKRSVSIDFQTTVSSGLVDSGAATLEKIQGGLEIRTKAVFYGNPANPPIAQVMMPDTSITAKELFGNFGPLPVDDLKLENIQENHVLNYSSGVAPFRDYAAPLSYPPGNTPVRITVKVVGSRQIGDERDYHLFHQSEVGLRYSGKTRFSELEALGLRWFGVQRGVLSPKGSFISDKR